MSPAPVDRPLVSFFVLAYRQEAYVRAAIEGAFAQTWRPLEIILSDDSSLDGTFRIMQEMAAAYDGPHRVVLNRNPRNLGLIGHINRVMALAQGDFVVQNAGDDVSRPERTARLVAAWQAGGGRVKAMHSRMNRIDAAGRVTVYPPNLPVMDRKRPRELIADHLHLIGASMGWSRQIFDVFGPLPTAAMIEDRPIAFRAALIGEIAYLDEALLDYRTGGESDPGEGEVTGGLHGYHLRRRRWDRSYLASYLQDMAIVAPPDAAACRRLCEDRILQLDFEIGLAEAGYPRRLRSLLPALILSLRTRRPEILGTNLKYLFDRPYLRYRQFRRSGG
jgi:glycosyltransferase involved in cell wall biosynthesis